MIPKLFSVKEAAQYLGLHPQTIKYHIYKTKLLKGQMAGRSRIFTQEELDRFAKLERKSGPKKGNIK